MQPKGASSQGLQGAYTAPQYLTDIPFGAYSHWIQPWRAYFETVPATRFLNGIGVVDNLNTNDSKTHKDALSALFNAGFRHVRIEIGWGSLTYEDEKLKSESLVAQIKDIQKAGLRPLILLNAHQGWPCPGKQQEYILEADAAKDSREIILTQIPQVTLGRSGISGLTDYWAAEALILTQKEKTLTLSKPLPKEMKKDTKIMVHTLKYRPFSTPGSADEKETLLGWRKYVQTVAEFVAAALGTKGASDKGFDLECWNELSFGTNFLSINRYYIPRLEKYNEDAVWDNIVKITADVLEESPSQYSGVALVNGFASTIPWTNSLSQPARVRAICKHPYASRKTYPKDKPQGNSLSFAAKEARFTPSYTAWFPEYAACALQTETITRDLASVANDIYGVRHDRNARPHNPCYVWITEYNVVPGEDGVKEGPVALRIKAKAAARALCFYLNKGVERFYFFAIAPSDIHNKETGDSELGMIAQSFLEGKSTDSGPILAGIQRYVKAFSRDLDDKLTPEKTRALKVEEITDTHNHTQFIGDNTPSHTSLYNREVLVILPYQVNSKRFVIPYYVMTRDIGQKLPPEKYNVTISGLHGISNGINAKFAAYDPLLDTDIPVTVVKRTDNSLTLTLTATDYPILLIVQEA